MAEDVVVVEDVFVAEDVVVAEVVDEDKDEVLLEDVEVDVDQDQVRGIAKTLAVHHHGAPIHPQS